MQITHLGSGFPWKPGTDSFLLAKEKSPRGKEISVPKEKILSVGNLGSEEVSTELSLSFVFKAFHLIHVWGWQLRGFIQLSFGLPLNILV